MDTQNGQDLVYDSELFDVWGTFISNTQAVQIRIDDKFRPNMTDPNIKYKKGVFDIIFATLYFSGDEVEEMFTPEEGGGKIPNIFFSLEPKNNLDNIFTSFGLELDISSIEKEFGAEPVPEGIYLTGNLNNTLTGKKAYRLKLNTNNIYMRVEYSSNSHLIDFALSSDIEAEDNDNFTNINIIKENGRKVMIVKFDEEYFSKNNDSLYFIVHTKDQIPEPKLQYYVFKYITSQNIDDISAIMNPKIHSLDVSEQEKNRKYTIKFSPLNFDEGVIYYIKAIYKDQVDDDENINTIAISEAKGKNVQITKPNKDGDKIIYNLEVNKEISYIKVLAKYNFVYGKYIYLYTPYENKLWEITYKDNYQQTFNNANKIRRFKLNFDSQSIPEYINVKIININKVIEHPILCFSPTDSHCNENREQLGKEGEMWIKKEQFIKENFYFTVECIDEN